MKSKFLTPLILFLAIAFSAGCADDDIPEQVSAAMGPPDRTTLDELLDVVAQGSPNTDIQVDPLTRLENCEADEAILTRIRELEVRLSELLIQFTERHPDVISTRQTRDEVVESALEDCAANFF